jgi:P27 family predicted phage terminase small subunit
VALVRVEQSVLPERPTPPRGWLKATLQEWEAFWQSEEGRASRRVEWPQIVRLFCLLDQWQRAWRVVQRDGPVVSGSQGQPVAHPLLKVLRECERAIIALEDRLGLSRRAMVSLGAQYSLAQQRMEDIQQVYVSDEDEDDPRIAIQES